MSVAVAISSIANDSSGGLDATQNEEIVDGTLTLSGNYGVANGHGDIVNFANDLIKSTGLPRQVEIFEDQGAGNAPLGYQFAYNHGTDLTNGKLVVLGTPASGGATTGATEFTQGSAYGGGTPSLSAAVLRFRAYFPKLV